MITQHAFLFVPVYAYIAVLLSFVCWFHSKAAGFNHSGFTELLGASQDQHSRWLFLINLTSLLGTPVSLGFFYKLCVFANISAHGLPPVFVAISMNLCMLVFYLQALRYTQALRRKTVAVPALSDNESKKTLALVFAVATVTAFATAPLLFDIVLSYVS